MGTRGPVFRFSTSLFFYIGYAPFVQEHVMYHYQLLFVN